MEYKVDLENRLGADFGSPKNLLYVPGVIANVGFSAIKNQFKKSGLRGKYAINETFDRIEITKPINYVFPLDPLVEVAWGFKNIITEQTVGEPVLEQVGKKMMSVRIRGILWDGSEKYPEKEIKEFFNIFKTQQIYEVNSRIFNVFGIKRIFVEDIQMPILEGYEDTQPFEIQAYSYKPVELEIIDL
ncbi:MAG: hypothetical protein EAZ27_04440 [Cytophagales bacterium]|nr:MAG: hypothetical protein EAZ27_04440 [Cytophagales bacterium]